MDESRVLFEDNHLIAIEKLPSDIVQGDKTKDKPLSEIVKTFLKEKYNKPGNVFCGVIHRIDRPVSGVIIFAKTSKALTRMNQLFQEKKIQKTYWAIVKNKPATTENRLQHYLQKNQKQNKSYPVQEEKGKKCELTYEVMSSSDHYHLLKITPHTGRHHQIRCQLSAIGSPIKGDLKYGFDRSNKNGSIHLHAGNIEFIHPVSQERVSIVCPPPSESLWDFFKEFIH
jgi:23S rRNA pseudouridine1911/1915/1917 synthase